MFRLRDAALQHRQIARQHLFAPAAELLIASLSADGRPRSLLCLEPGTALLGAAIEADPAWQDCQHVLLDTRLAGLQAASASSLRVCADALFAPFASARFDRVLANLLLGDADLDRALLRELLRLVRPGGQLVATVFLAGTFEEFFDVTQEICEQQGLTQSRAVLSDERASQYSPSSLRQTLEAGGFVDVRVGVENRAAPFDDGSSFIRDPVVQQVFLADWLASLGDARTRASTLDAVARSIDTYFQGIGFTARLVTGVVSARRAP